MTRCEICGQLSDLITCDVCGARVCLECHSAVDDCCFSCADMINDLVNPSDLVRADIIRYTAE